MKVKSARVCVDCDNVFGKNHISCPQCGSTTWFHLSRFVPSMDEDEHAVRRSYQPDHIGRPELDPQQDPPRPFFARCWQWITRPFRLEIDLQA